MFPLQHANRSARGGLLVPFPTTAGRGWTTITKTADETALNSTTLHADSQLRFLVTAGRTYHVRVRIFPGAVQSGTPDEKNTIRLCDLAGNIVADSFSFFIANYLATPNANTLSIDNPTTLTPTPHTASPATKNENTSASGTAGIAEYTYARWDAVITPTISGIIAVAWAQQNLSGVFATVVPRGSSVQYVEF